ncbi:hypothetical protein AUJ84_04060 [Candidatus Pacearchaeota archaeon CG1_02_32_132]|nr:MAG: hypothetical protein AUJ84_04060 [Candidatus Pacearchaeota archaeon CG1_02_32_132]
MARKSAGRGLGGWAFLIGVLLAIVLGYIGKIDSTWTWILVVIGLIVGFFNVAERETEPFLMSGAVLIIASAFGGTALNAVASLNNVLQALLLIFVPATVIVAIKHVFNMAKR